MTTVRSGKSDAHTPAASEKTRVYSAGRQSLPKAEWAECRRAQHQRRRKALTRPRGRASLAPPAARLEVDARAPRVAHAPPRGRAHAGALAYPVERPAALLGLAQQLVQPKRVRLVVLLHKLARARRPAARRLLARPLEAAVRPLEARRLEHSRLCLLLVRPLVLLGGRWPVDRLGGGARLEEGAVVDVVRVVAPKARGEAARLVEEPRVVQRLGRARHRLPECDSLGDVALRVARHLGPLPVLVLQPPLALALALPLLPQLVALAHVPLLLVARRVAGRQRRRRRSGGALLARAHGEVAQLVLLALLVLGRKPLLDVGALLHLLARRPLGDVQRL
mmetsp:Transcript_28136/g.88038  ORF Transcript_28136/g.88038 Transcript_28136/m.88038 type:complete len:336 (+) Transcript_28136:146-1153(+)